jgi:hypothetical protein
MKGCKKPHSETRRVLWSQSNPAVRVRIHFDFHVCHVRCSPYVPEVLVGAAIELSEEGNSGISADPRDYHRLGQSDRQEM